VLPVRAPCLPCPVVWVWWMEQVLVLVSSVHGMLSQLQGRDEHGY
jgi:hypothetical protein